ARQKFGCARPPAEALRGPAAGWGRQKLDWKDQPMRTERADINQLLQQMRQMQSQLKSPQLRESAAAEGLAPPAGLNATQGTDKVPGFGEMFRQAIDSVNEAQQVSTALATAYEKGDPGVSLSQVMVASQKASVSFQALT